MIPSSNQTPEPGLPSEAHAWLAEHPDIDPDGLEEAWRLSQHAPPPEASFALDPARVEAMRAHLHAAVIDEAPESGHRAKLTYIRTFPHSWAVAASIVLLIAVGAGLWLRPTVFTAPAGERRAATLPDGSTVELNSGARLSYIRTFGGRTRTVRLTGEAFFDVAHDAQKPFIVKTFNTSVTVLGTRFNVRAWSTDPMRETTVVLEEGQIQLASVGAPEQAVVLEPGQMSRVTGDEAPSAPAPVSVEQMLIWREGGFFFSDYPISVILAEAQRRFDVTIHIPDTLAQQRLALFLSRPESVDTILDAICGYLDCRYRATPKGYEILEAD